MKASTRTALKRGMERMIARHEFFHAMWDHIDDHRKEGCAACDELSKRLLANPDALPWRPPASWTSISDDSVQKYGA